MAACLIRLEVAKAVDGKSVRRGWIFTLCLPYSGRLSIPDSQRNAPETSAIRVYPGKRVVAYRSDVGAGKGALYVTADGWIMVQIAGGNATKSLGVKSGDVGSRKLPEQWASDGDERVAVVILMKGAKRSKT